MSQEFQSPSIKQLAKELNLSPGTVSVVLNGHGDEMRISPATQKRVLDVAREMNYKPNINAKRLKKSSDPTPVIGVFWTIDSNPNLIARFLSGMLQVKRYQEHKIELALLPYVYDNIRQSAHLLSKNYYHGVILMGLSENDIAFLKEMKPDIPMVLFNRTMDNCCSVNIDNFDIGYSAATLFHARGHEKIAIVASENASRSGKVKLSGFLTASLEYGYNLDDRLVLYEPTTYEGGCHAATQLFEGAEAPRPTAVFFQESNVAIGALSVLSRLNVRVPEDVEILSYGDNPQDAYAIPSLTSVHMPVEEMSCDCLRTVLQLIDNKLNKNVSSNYECSYIFRESCGDFNGKFILHQTRQ